MAQLATGDREEALDIVQEAMMGLAARYAHKVNAAVCASAGSASRRKSGARFTGAG
jgi:hypothetical protein